ncbi:helix-turn-helix domain-containing protein [Robbsia sp. Bb-Pol-6]|uniref:Helix-turn-helix domain-containing protein n=1 Tax=Robbsia betulipollinis TaxID=2981849 RepID=A0ABT3ZM13_9BURK|nr:helix-turn-helix domain-containing protein [Robbsia betulipollinis]MCY0386988.1 helix-turn-helix domain-containing protein [Robbsia betulipollinis]
MTTITTEGVYPAQRARFWRDAISAAFVELDCRIADPSPFRGSLKQNRVGPLSYTHVEAGGQSVSRPATRHVRHDEYILVSIGTTGHGILRQDCREARLEVGGFAVYDTARPYELHFDAPFSQAVIQIPRLLLKERLGMTEHVTATFLEGRDPLVQLTRDYLLALGRFADHDTAFETDRIAQQAVDLLAMALQSRQPADAMSTAPRATRLFRIKQLTESHLRDGEFGLAGLSARLHVSGRYINDLFSDEGTSFGRYLLARRLERCAEDLRAPGMRHRTINDVAFSWGFNNFSHFSATFRQHFGTSARAYRADHVAS